ncbi:SusD-like starch-binding protein associating with outer membrane [Maribacter vaceletii]|uniref:SusD-like starch-binding protein associating with outer membrane n=1 Tax=Maribacter vaceletii TaxID=1206816 RepID=A0A495EDF1_9FLAO|nr:RagB/SusD family nutrient uptake outer membrane protein [Maribacter vaceletii]RKR14912.1 SusD-like starch-binding protein associating with outer membrane [Maribacter vaceletii]
MKIKNIILGLTFIVGFVSCESLDVEPQGFYSDKNFYKTIEDAEASMLYAYDGLTSVSYAPVTYYITELSSDNCIVKPDEGADAQAFVNWEVNSQNALLSQYYRSIYIAINRANAVIENVEGKGFNPEDEKRLLGEALFLRAFNHFNAVRAFGLAPLQKSLIDKLNETTAFLPENMEEAYAFLIEDLTRAIDYLQVNRVTGRVDKVAAQALLAKVYLFAASAKESGVPKYDTILESADGLYAKAAEYAGYVLNSQGEYSHDLDLQNIYNVNEPNGPEHIFILSFDRSGTQEGDYSKLSKYFTPWLGGATVYLKNVDDTFSPTHDGWSVFQTTDDLYTSYESTDKRRNELLVSEIFDESGATIGTTADGFIPYAFTRKYIDPLFEGDKTSTRPYLIRYSDIQLVYAEATANNEGLIQYNQIRNRAGVSELADLGGLSKADFRELVIDERQRELAYEGDRLWDLRRKNIVQQEVIQAAGLSPEVVAFYPIPQREIDLNPNIN